MGPATNASSSDIDYEDAIQMSLEEGSRRENWELAMENNVRQMMGTIISTFVIGLIIFAFAKAGAIGVDSTSPLQRYARASGCVACLGSR